MVTPSLPSQSAGPIERATRQPTGQRPAGHGEEAPIDCSELWRASLAPEDPKLMAKDEDLKVLGTIIVAGVNHQASAIHPVTLESGLGGARRG